VDDDASPAAEGPAADPDSPGLPGVEPEAVRPPSRVGPDPVAMAGPSTGSADLVAMAGPSTGKADAGRQWRWRGWLRMATVDFGPLRRHRDLRLLFAGQAVSFAGSMITYVAIPYQVFQLTRSSLVVGPALGGLLIAQFGLAATYGVDVVSFMVSLVALSLMRALPPPAGAERPSLRGVLEGLRYARSRQELLGTYIVDIVAMLFGMPTALFPAIAARYGGPGALGLLYAAPSVGSFLANATSGWTGHVHRHGRAILIAAAVWGAAIAGFGFAGPLWLALGLLALAGAADMVSGIFRSTIWNQTIPDHLRGRLAGIELLSYSTGPLLGNVEAGAVASLFSVRVSVVSGGLLSVLGVGVVAVALPAFRAYDARRWARDREAPVPRTA